MAYDPRRVEGLIGSERGIFLELNIKIGYVRVYLLELCVEFSDCVTWVGKEKKLFDLATKNFFNAYLNSLNLGKGNQSP